MMYRIAAAPGKSVRRSLIVAVSGLALAGSAAVAQQPAQPAPQRPPQAQQRPPQAQQQQRPPAQRPAQAPAQQQQQQQQAQEAQQMQQGETPQLIYSPWAKFCNKGQEMNARQVCFTGRDARTESGIPVVAAALIEPDGDPKKIFRVTLPSPLQLQYGTRIVIDQNQPLAQPFFTCFANGCMADYEGTVDLITKLKKGQTLQVQAINLAGNQVSFPVPLAEFQKANEGAPTDPKVFEEQQRKLQEELQKRADDARRKLEGQGGAPTR
jgi:invasion protein IalB